MRSVRVSANCSIATTLLAASGGPRHIWLIPSAQWGPFLSWAHRESGRDDAPPPRSPDSGDPASDSGGRDRRRANHSDRWNCLCVAPSYDAFLSSARGCVDWTRHATTRTTTAASVPSGEREQDRPRRRVCGRTGTPEPTAGYMRLVKDRILHVWAQRRAEANGRTVAQHGGSVQSSRRWTSWTRRSSTRRRSTSRPTAGNATSCARN